MKEFIRQLEPRTIHVTFGFLYGISLLLALFPPLYLAASGVSTRILGLPFSVFYWLFDGLLVGLSLWALYLVEGIRGELDEAFAVVSGPSVGSPSSPTGE
ncbi:hypothetical protein G8767_21955 [Rhodococcus sp. IC4_135]|uniref:hypothetical protein n=1 Tax=Rhodococcus sp. IC4_135 TaxID=2715537 RepID=UPI0014211D5A|nr:hypothetical protein [Rhodococcus sp. IC4_135]